MGKLQEWLDKYKDDNAIPLFTPIFALMMADLVLTIFQQPAKYWAFGFENYIEGNIIGKWLLEAHPLLFVYTFLIYLVISYLLVTRSKPLYKFATIFGLLIGHVPAVIGRLDTVFEIALLRNIPTEKVSHDSIVFLFDMTVIIYFSLWISRTFGIYMNGNKTEGDKKS